MCGMQGQNLLPILRINRLRNSQLKPWRMEFAATQTLIRLRKLRENQGFETNGGG